jgi:hypothetical protein
MDEASSRFVDRLVMDKIVTEKLTKVHHAPKEPIRNLMARSFEGFVRTPGATRIQKRLRENCLVLESPISDTYEENRWLSVFPSLAHDPKANIILVHGLFEESRNIYDFLIANLNRLGFSVYLMTLPFHYERQPSESRFSGEYFFSADLGRTKRAFRQAALEVQLCHEWLQMESDLPIFGVGFSMGGTVIQTVCGLANSMDGNCIINPAASLPRVMWTSPLCQTIKLDLLGAGLAEEQVNEVLKTFDPLQIKSGNFEREKMLLIYGCYDEVAPPDQYENLIKTWGLEGSIRYKSGHLNILRVPRLAEDIRTFFNGIMTAVDHELLEVSI